MIAPLRRARYGLSHAVQRLKIGGTGGVEWMNQPDETTHFGFRDVPLGDKQTLVNDVFHSVARRYDLMNDLMSAGLHRVWKDLMINALNPPRCDAPFALLDVAGGTGDIAFRAAEAAGPGFKATVCDINSEMLAVGRERAATRHLDDRVSFVEGNAEELAFAEQHLRRLHHRVRHPQRAADRSRAAARRFACCGRAADSCALNSPPSTCRGSIGSTICFRSR